MSSFWTWFILLAIVASLYVLAKGVLWFIQPILIYSRRKTEKDIEFYIAGLGLVVPCYNEEKRLPQMLSEHITYI